MASGGEAGADFERVMCVRDVSVLWIVMFVGVVHCGVRGCCAL